MLAAEHVVIERRVPSDERPLKRRDRLDHVVKGDRCIAVRRGQVGFAVVRCCASWRLVVAARIGTHGWCRVAGDRVAACARG